jgi:hypothetical protein
VTGKQRQEARAGQGDLGWHILQWSAAAILLDGVGQTITSVLDTDPQLRLPVGLLMLGLTILSGLVCFGVWQRSRWGIWLGTGRAVAAIILIPLSYLAQATTPSGARLVETPLSITLVWLDVVCSAAFLVGLLMLRAARRR